AIEASLVNRKERAKAHRDGRELPELGHQIRVRVGREPAAFGQVLAKILQVLFREPSFEVSARVISGRGVALKINHVRGPAIRGSAKEMIEANLIQSCQR